MRNHLKYALKVQEIHLKSGGNGAGIGFWGMVLGVDWIRGCMGKTLEKANEIHLKTGRMGFGAWRWG